MFLQKVEKRVKKEKLTKILIIAILVVAITLVIVTSIVINNQKKILEDLNQKNEQVKPEEGTTNKENKIFLKNFEIFIDIDKKI